MNHVESEAAEARTDVRGRGGEASASNLNSLIRKAFDLQSQDRHAQALEVAQSVSSRFPNHLEALLIVGQSQLMLGQHQECVGTLGRLLQLRPRHAMGLNNRGVAHEALGQMKAALADYRGAVQAEPEFLDARLNEARCLHRMGHHEQSAQAFSHILEQVPNLAAAHVGAGQAFVGSRQEDRAIGHLQRALELEPYNGMAWHALGDAHLEFRHWELAVEAYGQASTLLPQHALTYSNCAKALRELRQYEDALMVCEAAITMDATCLPARRNKIVILLDLERWLMAIEACHDALKLAPTDAHTHNNLGFAFASLRHYPAALDAYRAATQHEPNMAIAWVNQACMLEAMNVQDGVIECYERAFAADPNYPQLLGRLAHARLYRCDWTDAASSRQKIMQGAAQGHSVCDPFRIISFSDRAEDQQALARLTSAQLPQPVKPWPPLTAKPPGERIRVGYFSADFHHHATAMLMAQMFELHDKSRFEIMALSFGDSVEDAMRQRLRAAFDGFHDLSDLNDDEAVEVARSLDLHIAVDLKGYTLDNRVGLFQRRVAPIQISYLGFPGTLGAEFMDYILADRVVIPDHLRHFYDEKVIRVRGTYQANDAGRVVQAGTVSRSSLGLPENAFVFCCFNNNYKITPEVFALWMRLLKRVSGSVLWLLADSSWARENLCQQAASHGVEPNRLVFAERAPIDRHLARQRSADLFLDTIPCNAHTTASDALRVGLPLVTCMGTSFASRVAGSLLHAQGLADLATENLEAYEHKALELALNPSLMAAVRQRAHEAVHTGSMLATHALTRQIEAAYELALERAIGGQTPQHIDL